MSDRNVDPLQDYQEEVKRSISTYKNDAAWQKLSNDWMIRSLERRYTHNFSYLGLPIIQMPADIVAMQEIIWRVRPDLIIETGIARGGSVIHSASQLALLDYCEAVASGKSLVPKETKRQVVAIDLDIRAHNRAAIEAHPLSHRIKMIQGSSIAPKIVSQVTKIVQAYETVLICLDSNHTHDHVLAELEAYAPLTTLGSYCVVFDTIVENLPDSLSSDRPWKKGNNPRTAVWEYLKRLETEQHLGADGSVLRFESDRLLEDKLLLTVAPEGFLKRI